MQTDRAHQSKVPAQVNSLYTELMAHAVGLPNDEIFAQMIASQVEGIGALPPGLGMAVNDFALLMAQHFPGF